MTHTHEVDDEPFAGPFPPGEPVELFSLAGWPVMTLTPLNGGLAVVGLDRASGVFVPRFDLHTRLREGSIDLDMLDMSAFRALVRGWRERLMQAHCAVASDWIHTGNGEFPLRGEIAGQAALIRVNDYPAEPMYSVLVCGQNIGNLEEWPPAWRQVNPRDDSFGPEGMM